MVNNPHNHQPNHLDCELVDSTHTSEHKMLEYVNNFAAHSKVPCNLVIDCSSDCAPVVSIAIPTYKRPDLLREAIHSALAQVTELSFEVIVVDNDPDSNDAAIVDQLVRSFQASNLRLFRNQSNIGMFGNWNRCISLSRGNWLTILNDDDLLHPNFLESVWNERNGQSLVACRATFSTNLQTVPTPVFNRIPNMLMKLWDYIRFRDGRREIQLSDVLYGNPVTASLGVLFHKESLVKIGGYNEMYWPNADYVLNVRYWMNFGATLLKNKLATYRIIENASLKIDTLSGFVLNDFALREELIGKFSPSARYSSILSIISRFQAVAQAHLYKNKINPQFPANECLEKLHLENSFRYARIIPYRATSIAWWLASKPIELAHSTRNHTPPLI